MAWRLRLNFTKKFGYITPVSGCLLLFFATIRLKPRFAAKALVAKYKGKAKDVLPVARLEFGNTSGVKRKRQGRTDVEEATPNEDVLGTKAITAVKMMVNEIKWWKEKADTLIMNRKEYEADLKVAFDMLKAKEEEMEEVRKKHVKEMETLRDELVAEAAKFVFDARIEMIREYQAGQHSAWNLEEEYATLKRIVRERPCEVTSRNMDKMEQVGETQEGGRMDKGKGIAFD